ncbi:hypothetical protein D3C85_1108650 [compost metagenome]
MAIGACIRNDGISTPVSCHTRIIFNADIICAGCSDEHVGVAKGLPQRNTITVSHYATRHAVVNLFIVSAVVISQVGITITPLVVCTHAATITDAIIPVAFHHTVSEVIIIEQCPTDTGQLGCISLIIPAPAVGCIGIMPRMH